MMGKGESQIQSSIMDMLLIHHKVAWAHVTTTGTVKGRGGGSWFKAGYPGMADIIGQLRDGRLLAIEVKQPGKAPSKIQEDFINMVIKNNGIAGVAESVENAQELLK